MPGGGLPPERTVNCSLSEMDIVYPLAERLHNRELQYSLRSLANFPHRQVWFTGYLPPWLAGCGYIPDAGGATKEARIYNSVLAAAVHPDISDTFVLFNDDFFVSGPVAELPPAYYLPLRDQIDEPAFKHVYEAGESWAKSVLTTLELLESLGVTNALSYELHIPMAFDKKVLAELMLRYVSDNPPQLRSLYGNLAQIGGNAQRDVKVFEEADPIHTPFFSTFPLTFSRFEPRLKEMFPDLSPYEKAGVARLILGALIDKKARQD